MLEDRRTNPLLRWAARVPVPARRPHSRRRSFPVLAATLVLASLAVGSVVAVVLLTRQGAL